MNHICREETRSEVVPLLSQVPRHEDVSYTSLSTTPWRCGGVEV